MFQEEFAWQRPISPTNWRPVRSITPMRCPKPDVWWSSSTVTGGVTTTRSFRAASRCAGSPARRAATSPRGCSARPAAPCSTWSRHGDAFDEARDDVEYFRGAGRDAAVPRARHAPLRPGLAASRRSPRSASRRSGGWRRGAASAGVVLATVRGAAAARAAPGAARARACSTLAVGDELDPQRADGAAGVPRLRAPARGRGGRPLRAARRHPRRLSGRARRSAAARVRRRHDRARCAASTPARSARSSSSPTRTRAAALRGGGRAATRRARSPSGCAPRATRRPAPRDERGRARRLPVPRRAWSASPATTTPTSARCSTTCPTTRSWCSTIPAALRERAEELERADRARLRRGARALPAHLAARASCSCRRKRSSALPRERPGADWMGPIAERRRGRALRAARCSSTARRPSRCSARSSG